MLVLSDPTWIYYAVLLLVLVASASWILKCAPGSSTNQVKFQFSNLSPDKTLDSRA